MSAKETVHIRFMIDNECQNAFSSNSFTMPSKIVNRALHGDKQNEGIPWLQIINWCIKDRKDVTIEVCKFFILFHYLFVFCESANIHVNIIMNLLSF